MVFNWDNEKNQWLKKERNISFEQVLIAIESGDIVDILEHPNKKRFTNQILILVAINDYVYAVPAVENNNDEEYFLKTIYPSRKYTERYLQGKRR